VTNLLPRDLSHLVAEYVVKPTTLNAYVTVLLDSRTVDQTQYQWDPGLAQCLSSYCINQLNTILKCYSHFLLLLSPCGTQLI
jgi:hypothetical protein